MRLPWKTKNQNTRTISKESKKSFFHLTNQAKQEALKGKTATQQGIKQVASVTSNIGEDHIVDMQKAEELITKDGLVASLIRKYVNHIISPGLHVVSKNKKAEDLINNWIKEQQFPVRVKPFVHNALSKGIGYLELDSDPKGGLQNFQVLESKYIWVKRNDMGEVEEYNQKIPGLEYEGDKDYETLPLNNMVHFSYNVIGDNVYGIGLIKPNIHIINNYLGNTKEMQTLLSRKANSPYDITVGTEEEPASEADIEAAANDFDYLNNMHEWIHDHRVKVDKLDFGDLAGKFEFVFESDMERISCGFEVPQVIMGKGNIPEGLAKEQKEEWSVTINSIREELEVIFEEKLWKRILQANGLEAEVETQWGRPTSREKNEEATKLTSVLSLGMLSSPMRDEVELKLAENLGIDPKTIIKAREERENEEQTPQPLLPGQNNQPNSGQGEPGNEETDEEFLKKKINSCSCNHHSEGLIKKSQDYQLKEWVGFNFTQYLAEIINFVNNDDFSNLAAQSQEDMALGKLTTPQVETLKQVLNEGFENNKTLREIGEEIQSRVSPGDLFRINQNGDRVLQFGEEHRSKIIARSETTRAAANGGINHYAKKGVKEVSFVATFSDRTCPQCEELNGQIVSLSTARNVIPVHVGCRCTWVPVDRG